MYNQVKEFIHKRIQIPEPELEKTFQFIEVKHFKKGDYIIKMDEYYAKNWQVNKKLTFVKRTDDKPD